VAIAKPIVGVKVHVKRLTDMIPAAVPAAQTPRGGGGDKLSQMRGTLHAAVENIDQQTSAAAAEIHTLTDVGRLQELSGCLHMIASNL